MSRTATFSWRRRLRFSLRILATLFLFLLLLLSSSSSFVECSRTLKVPVETREATTSYTWLESQLPRGFVPPSGPSVCHHKLSPYQLRHRDQVVAQTEDYSACP
ncbi:hypothetical protein LINPERHAP1_LOCUS25333 [Linum perenne]